MEDMAHCKIHPEKPTEYVCLCPSCKNLPLCETCKREHEAGTRHATENCKEVGLAIMHQRIQDANGRQAKELAGGLKKALKELETELLQEIDRLQLSCIPTDELRKMRKLDTEGRYAELYFYAKTLPADDERNKAAMGGLNKRLVEMLDKASDGLKKVLGKSAVAAQYKPIFATCKKDEVLVIEGESYKGEEKIVSALHNADMSKLKAVYINSLFSAGDRVASELTSRLQARPVSALYLSGCNISDAGAEVLAQAAFRGKSLSAFCIRSNDISDAGAKAVAEAARNSRSLNTFYLYCWKISDSGAIAVAEAVNGCPLSTFFLYGFKISNAGALAVAKTMKSCPLSAFCLMSNDMSDEGAIAVAETVKDCPLSAFYFGSSRISDPGATAVAETLSNGRCASTLSALYLGSSGLSDSGVKKVADAVRGCTRLSAFYIDSMPISGEAVAHVLGSMAGVSTIRSVNLCISEISKAQMDSCLDRLGQSGVAGQLKLRFQSYTKATITACERSTAERNAKLAEFSIVSDIGDLFMNEVIIGLPK